MSKVGSTEEDRQKQGAVEQKADEAPFAENEGKQGNNYQDPNDNLKHGASP